MLAAGELLQIGNILVHAPVLEGLKLALMDRVGEFHKRNPLSPGISKETLRDAFGTSPEIFAAALEALVREKKLELADELVHAAGRGVVMKDEEAEAKKIIERAFSTAGLKVPALKEVLAGLPVDAARAQKIVTLLLRDRVLFKISDDLVFHRDALEQLRRTVTAHKAKSPRIDVGQFKDLTGVTRKYAIPLLEWLDRERVTRRIGDAREIL
jgi:selenocysteine-specific elongation factor